LIVVDTSAVVAILFAEPTASALSKRLARETFGDRLMTAAAYVEAGTVLAGRHASPERALEILDGFLASGGIRIVPITEALARIALDARIRFGRGFGAPAGLNFGDSFSYALAKSLNAPLLFVGNDFAETDIVPALTD